MPAWRPGRPSGTALEDPAAGRFVMPVLMTVLMTVLMAVELRRVGWLS